MSVKHIGVIGDGLGVMCGSKQKIFEKSGKIFFHQKKSVSGSKMAKCASKWAINLINEQISWRPFEWYPLGACLKKFSGRFAPGKFLT